jgi:hypothetical protein
VHTDKEVPIEPEFDGDEVTGTAWREVRALFDESTVTVYQAYTAEIAAAATAAQNFVHPFRLNRMTWIKPSFAWMMYRSNWAQRPGQERILSIRIARANFDQTLLDSCLSSYDESVYGSHDDWVARKRSSGAIVQWDPERSLSLERLAWRSIQIGLTQATAHEFASSWEKEITDVTDLVREIKKDVVSGRIDLAERYRPVEAPYPMTSSALQATAATDYAKSMRVAPAERSSQSSEPKGAG